MGGYFGTYTELQHLNEALALELAEYGPGPVARLLERQILDVEFDLGLTTTLEEA